MDMMFLVNTASMIKLELLAFLTLHSYITYRDFIILKE